MRNLIRSLLFILILLFATANAQYSSRYVVATDTAKNGDVYTSEWVEIKSPRVELFATSNDSMRCTIRTDYRIGGAYNYLSYTDSLVTTSNSGASKGIILRGFTANTDTRIPGANYVRFVVTCLPNTGYRTAFKLGLLQY